MINVGVVGLGFAAAKHLKAYRQLRGVRIAALCNPSGRHLDGDFAGVSGNIGGDKPLRLDMSGVEAYRDFYGLLANPEIHLVDICAPTSAHPELAIAALKAGRHVVCEKPLARTPGHARKIVNAAKSAKGFLMPAMCMRFWPEWVWAKRAVEGRNYGKVLAARFRRVCQAPVWNRKSYLDGKNSGGALLDLHIHDVDFVQWLFGRPLGVFSSGLSRFTGAVDHVVTQYKVRGGAAVSAEASWLMTQGFGFNMSYTLIFERATADYDFARGAEALRIWEEGQGTRVIRCAAADAYVEELHHMIESIQSGKPPGVVTAQDALSAIEICEAEERSIRSGRVVSV